MIMSFTDTDYYFYDTKIEQDAKNNNGIFIRGVLQKNDLRGLPDGTSIYLKIDRYSKAATRLVFQFPKLHFHLYGKAEFIRHTKLRAYVHNIYPELFI